MQLLYLEDLQAQQDLPVGLGVLQLVIEPAQTAPNRARQLLQQAQQQLLDSLISRNNRVD